MAGMQGKAPDKPPTTPVPHTWYVADEQRYCTRCGFVQTLATDVWQPTPAYECEGELGPPSNAADIKNQPSQG